jgi:sigma-B regulation protein RsbU (phosphoserine phosphatase)
MASDIIDLLKKAPMFGHLPQATLDYLAGGVEVRQLARDEVLIRRGEPATSLFIIRAGWVKLIITGPGDQELVFNKLGPGQMIGESSLFDGAPRSSSVVAITPLQVIELRYDFFLAALEQHPALNLIFIGKILDRLRFANRYIEKAIEWSRAIAEGNYEAAQSQIQTVHTTIVNTGQAEEVRIAAFLSALIKMVKGVRQREETLEQVILPLGVALSMERDPEQLLERIVIEAKSICTADAGILYLLGEDNHLRFAIVRIDSLNIAWGGTTGRAIPFPPLPLYDEMTGQPNDYNLAARVALSGRLMNIPDVYRSEGFDLSGDRRFDQEHGYHTTSNLTVPLKNHADQVIGVLQLLNTRDQASNQIIPFDSYHQLVAESLASLAAVALNNQILLAREESLIKFERDIHIGRQIQLDFLPKPDQLPQPPGWEIATYFQAARGVAGDFFDVFPIQNKIGLVVADVCDKGVGAALFMSLSRSLIRAFAEQPRPLGRLDDLDRPLASLNPDERRQTLLSAGTNALLSIELTNNYIAHNHGDMNMFATVFFGVLDPATGLLTYINGGHLPPAIVNSMGQVKARLPVTGPAVGLMAEANFGIKRTQLEPGDILFAFSDGVTDARSPDKKFFKERSLLPLLAQPVDSAATLLARIETGLKTHIADADQFDDITMLAARRLFL